MTPSTEVFGASSRRSSSRLAPTSVMNSVTPVTLRPLQQALRYCRQWRQVPQDRALRAQPRVPGGLGNDLRPSGNRPRCSYPRRSQPRPTHDGTRPEPKQSPRQNGRLENPPAEAPAAPARATATARLRAPQRPPAASLDHLVGTGEEGGWDSDAESEGGLEIDDQFELRWLLNRQIARFRPAKDFINVVRSTAVQVRQTRPIGHEASCLDELSGAVHRG